MFFGIRDRQRRVLELRSDIQEIERFQSEYERILEKLKKGERFEFKTWFKEDGDLEEDLEVIHQNALKFLEENGRRVTPERVVGVEGFKIQDKKSDEVEKKLGETISEFENCVSYKFNLLEKVEKSLKFRKYIFLSLIMVFWVLLVIGFFNFLK